MIDASSKFQASLPVSSDYLIQKFRELGIAFEVFEHMKFDEMNIILKNIKNKINENIFMSVPIYKKTHISLELKIKSY